MGNFLTIGQVAYRKPLRLCNMEELAAHQRGTQARSGVLFARNTDREQKDDARQRILDLFDPSVWPRNLSILTMPGLDWRFERKLLGSREVGWMRKFERPKRTFITSIENDRAIYYSAVAEMPGGETLNPLTKICNPPSFAEQSVKTKFIRGQFFFANVDDLMRETAWEFDAVWLDYTGPMSKDRMRLIEQFYHRSVRHTLVVTVLKARWNRETSAAIKRAGGHSEWLRKHLPGEVLHDIEYFDTSPMAQFAVRKEPT